MINTKESRNYDARNGQHARHDETSTKMQKKWPKRKMFGEELVEVLDD